MNVLDNHITDLDNRIKDICEIAPTVEQSSIQESLSSYGWILLDSWIAWRTLRFLIKDQDISVETQRKWFQTPSSFTASQIKAVWHFGDNVDTFLNENAGHGLKYLIDNEIEKLRNASAHFSDGGVVNGSDYQKIGNYHQLLSNIFLLYEIISFFISLSVNVFETNDASLKMINKNDKMIFEYVLNKKAINYDFNIIDLRKVSIVRIGSTYSSIGTDINISCHWLLMILENFDLRVGFIATLVIR